MIDFLARSNHGIATCGIKSTRLLARSLAPELMGKGVYFHELDASKSYHLDPVQLLNMVARGTTQTGT